MGLWGQKDTLQHRNQESFACSSENGTTIKWLVQERNSGISILWTLYWNIIITDFAIQKQERLPFLGADLVSDLHVDKSGQIFLKDQYEDW